MKPISQTWPSGSPQSQAQRSRELREPAVEGVTAASTLPGAGAVGFREPLRDEPELDKTVPRFLGAPFSGGEKAKASARAGPWGRRHITGTPQACQRPRTSTGSSRGHHGPANGPARPRGQQARTLAGPGRHPAARGGRPAERGGGDSASGQGRCGAVLCHRLADVAVAEATFCAPAHVRLFSPCVEMLFPDFPRYRLKK